MRTLNEKPEIPLQITFHHAEPISDVEDLIRKEVTKLGLFYSRILGCRVAIEGANCRRRGNPWDLRIDITVPGTEIVIREERSLKGRARRTGHPAIEKQMEARRLHKDLRLAIRNAFRSAKRRLQDYVRCRRGEIKRLNRRPTARVSRIFHDEGFGFITTQEGRHIYFNENSVLNRAFARLQIGSDVAFAEEAGERGPQASSVRIVSRQQLRSPKTSAA